MARHRRQQHRGRDSGAALASRAIWCSHAPAAALIAVAPQLSRYALVSALALALDFAVYLALTTLAVRPALAGVIGYAAGTVLHYLLSVALRVRRRAPPTRRRRACSASSR